MENHWLAGEEASDMPAPLRKKRAAAKALCMRLQRGPCVNHRVLIRLLNAALHTRPQALRVLADDIQAVENGRAQFFFFAWRRGEDGNFGNHGAVLLRVLRLSYHNWQAKEIKI